MPEKQPLLEVSNLKKWFPVHGGWFAKTRHVRAVDGVSLDVLSGETVGLVGESGCGKTTLGKTIVRLEDPTSGVVRVDGVDITSLTGKALRASRGAYQMIFQDPHSSLNPRMTIAATLDEVLGLHTELDGNGRRERIRELMSIVGLNPDQVSRYPHQFSGGQKQRVGIARALAVNPKLIVADEPVSALDVSVQAQIINLLREIQSKTGVSFVFIAHDLAVVEHISHRILVMYLGKIVESGPAKLVCGSPRHPYTQALLSAVPTLDPETRRMRVILPGDTPSPIDPPSGCRFHPRCPIADKCCAEKEPPLVGYEGHPEHLSACFFPGKSIHGNSI